MNRIVENSQSRLIKDRYKWKSNLKKVVMMNEKAGNTTSANRLELGSVLGENQISRAKHSSVRQTTKTSAPIATIQQKIQYINPTKSELTTNRNSSDEATKPMQASKQIQATRHSGNSARGQHQPVCSTRLRHKAALQMRRNKAIHQKIKPLQISRVKNVKKIDQAKNRVILLLGTQDNEEVVGTTENKVKELQDTEISFSDKMENTELCNSVTSATFGNTKNLFELDAENKLNLPIEIDDHNKSCTTADVNDSLIDDVHNISYDTCNDTFNDTTASPIADKYSCIVSNNDDHPEVSLDDYHYEIFSLQEEFEKNSFQNSAGLRYNSLQAPLSPLLHSPRFTDLNNMKTFRRIPGNVIPPPSLPISLPPPFYDIYRVVVPAGIPNFWARRPNISIPPTLFANIYTSQHIAKSDVFLRHIIEPPSLPI